ncbi:MAG: DUF6441 family protein [Rhodospirillales bacterium]|nr:DUF6441 family protein [Rhodospirillales bacterium]MDP7098485.1 DUF6441 family protein [Rhodospirillales bacterium]HIJ93094.1 hypothetical protein [Rhodospirillaceae bacterium]HJP53310.1 DUF6441 family protein [Rhodospirillales bacterium]
MKLATTIAGSIKAGMEAEIRTISKAVTAGVKEAGRGIKGDLRKQVVSAGLGMRLSRTWRERTYPNKGHDAASLVWSKAPQIIRAFDEGAVIKSKSGFWLAIPTPSAPKRGVGGKRINPSNFPEHRFGPLRFVYRRNGPSLLVVDAVRVNARTGRVGRRAKGGAFTKTGRMKQGMATSVMFIMVPRVRLKKRLDVKREIKRWERRLPGLIDRHMPSR